MLPSTVPNSLDFKALIIDCVHTCPCSTMGSNQLESQLGVLNSRVQ